MLLSRAALQRAPPISPNRSLQVQALPLRSESATWVFTRGSNEISANRIAPKTIADTAPSRIPIFAVIANAPAPRRDPLLLAHWQATCRIGSGRNPREQGRRARPSAGQPTKFAAALTKVTC